MAHIAFAAPGIRRFHLHERLARELTARGHRVTALHVDAVTATFWSAQEPANVAIAPTAPIGHRAPLAEFAQADCLLQGRRSGGGSLAHARRRLARLLPGIVRWFDTDPPDLLFGHQQRSGVHRLLQFVARECGCRTLWTADGMLPHTLQTDEEGVDGDAAICRRAALDYRDEPADESLLAAALAAALGRTTPAALARRPLRAPPWRRRLADALELMCRGRLAAAATSPTAWRGAAPPPVPEARRCELPEHPFLAVLLQREDDATVLLDCAAPPTAAGLVLAARAAADRVDHGLGIVAVLPAGGLPAHQVRRLRRLARVRIETAAATLDAAAAAMAVVTIGHPAATTALLARTPVVHLGRALFALPGVTRKSTLDGLPDALAAALRDDQPTLRARFLTTLLGHDHVWCAADHPDHNGLSGLVLAIESRLQQDARAGARLRYRPGPTWPLAAEPRSR